MPRARAPLLYAPSNRLRCSFHSAGNGFINHSLSQASGVAVRHHDRMSRRIFRAASAIGTTGLPALLSPHVHVHRVSWAEAT